MNTPHCKCTQLVFELCLGACQSKFYIKYRREYSCLWLMITWIISEKLHASGWSPGYTALPSDNQTRKANALRHWKSSLLCRSPSHPTDKQDSKLACLLQENRVLAVRHKKHKTMRLCKPTPKPLELPFNWALVLVEQKRVHYNRSKNLPTFLLYLKHIIVMSWDRKENLTAGRLCTQATYYSSKRNALNKLSHMSHRARHTPIIVRDNACLTMMDPTMFSTETMGAECESGGVSSV